MSRERIVLGRRADVAETAALTLADTRATNRIFAAMDWEHDERVAELLDRRRNERDEFGRRKNKVRCGEMPLVAGNKNRTVVEQGQSRFKKHPVLFVGKFLGVCNWRHGSALCASAISALISSIVHSRPPLENRSALPRSNVSQNRRPSILCDSGAAVGAHSPIMNGIVRVRTTWRRNTVRALVMVRPSSSKISSQLRLRSSSIRSVVVMYVSLVSNECQRQVLYHITLSESRGGGIGSSMYSGGMVVTWGLTP